jgi:Rrf2 family protein
MKLSHASAYALQALCRLAAGDEGDLLAAGRLAPGAPVIFLRKALGALVSGGVLCSVMGPGGGYRLARSADRITLLEVVEAIEGPLRGEAGHVGGGLGGLDQRLQAFCDQAAQEARKPLARVRISDLAAG